jgi:hypothetical protein
MSELTITWSWEDLESLRPDWSEDKCKESFDKVRKTLHDRSIEEGWDILRDLLSIIEFEGKNEN